MGRGSTPATCPLNLVPEYVDRAGLKVSPNCTKKEWSLSPCETCGRIEKPRSNWLLSKDVVRKAVEECLERKGVAPDNSSPVSMRRGGVSAAVAGGVSETLWKLQSGHRGDRKSVV